MTIGNSVSGGSVVSNNQAAGIGSTVLAAFDDVDPVDLRSPPWLQFFELDPQDGTTPSRFVDWADPNDPAIPSTGQVTFDGDTWESVSIARPRLEESTTGRLPEIVVALNDPHRVILSYVKSKNNLKGAKITVRIIRYDQILTPDSSIDNTFRVRAVQSLEGPSRVQIAFGAPSMTGIKYPTVKFTRSGCHNVFERRYVHDGRNFCNSPSEEFGPQTAQLLTASADTETELLFGWHVINGATGYPSAQTPQTNFTPDAHYLVANRPRTEERFAKLWTTRSLRWNTTNREALFAFIKLVDDSPESTVSDVDVSVRILGPSAPATASTIDCVAAIMIQDDSDESAYVEWGRRYTAANPVAWDYFHQDGATDDQTIDPDGDNVDNTYRIKRTASDTWELYSRFEDPTTYADDSTAWTLRTTITESMSGDIRVGIIAHHGENTQPDAVVSEGQFAFLRFAAGGHAKCNRTLAHCVARKNVHQRNAYVSMPDGIVRF